MNEVVLYSIVLILNNIKIIRKITLVVKHKAFICTCRALKEEGKIITTIIADSLNNKYYHNKYLSIYLVIVACYLLHVVGENVYSDIAPIGYRSPPTLIKSEWALTHYYYNIMDTFKIYMIIYYISTVRP